MTWVLLLRSALVQAPIVVMRYTMMFILIVSCVACSKSIYQEDADLSANFTAQMNASANSSFDPSQVFGNNWRKACFVTPYTLKEGFEQETGEQVDNYEALIEDSYIALWVFGQENQGYKVFKIPRVGNENKILNKCISQKNFKN